MQTLQQALPDRPVGDVIFHQQHPRPADPIQLPLGLSPRGPRNRGGNFRKRSRRGGAVSPPGRGGRGPVSVPGVGLPGHFTADRWQLGRGSPGHGNEDRVGEADVRVALLDLGAPPFLVVCVAGEGKLKESGVGREGTDEMGGFTGADMDPEIRRSTGKGTRTTMITDVSLYKPCTNLNEIEGIKPWLQRLSETFLLKL